MAIKKAKQGSKKSKRGDNSQVECYFFDVEKCKHRKYKEGCYKEGAKYKSYSVKIKDNRKNSELEKLFPNSLFFCTTFSAASIIPILITLFV